MDPFVERKFKQLREKLDQFGYRQALGVESLPLAERLFADIIQTTASLRDAKQYQASANQKGQASSIPSDAEPYRKDNARLVKVSAAGQKSLSLLSSSSPIFLSHLPLSSSSPIVLSHLPLPSLPSSSLIFLSHLRLNRK